MAKRTRTRGHTIQWPKEQGQEDKQYNGQKNKDKRTNNTMANGQKNKDKMTNIAMAK
jgi:hypothetical protein